MRMRFKETAAGLPDVVIARSYRYMCSNPGQEMIVKDIQELGLNRVVVAACSPRMHERTFRNACKTGGLNPYLCEMANIREQCSWVHADKLAATEKARALTQGAVNRVRYHEPLDPLTAEMCPSTLVLGGGIAGIDGCAGTGPGRPSGLPGRENRPAGRKSGARGFDGALPRTRPGICSTERTRASAPEPPTSR